jgi:hypothetical protein
MRTNASGSLRERLDRLTGMDDRRRLDDWRVMSEMLRDAGLEAAVKMLTTHHGSTFDAFAEACMLVKRAEESDRRVRGTDLNSAYLRVRTAIEFSLTAAFERYPPGDAWEKVKGLPGPAVGETIARHAEEIGFGGDLLPAPVRRATENHLRAVCMYKPSGRIRPSLAALILAATDVAEHPMRRLAQAHPRWLVEVDALASAAGAAVHRNSANDLETLHGHLRQCAGVLNTLESAMG